MSTAATLGYCFAFLFVCQNALCICKLQYWSYWHSFCDHFAIFEAFPGQTFELRDLEIQNTVANASIDLAEDEFLDLERFYSDHSRWCTYQVGTRASMHAYAHSYVRVHMYARMHLHTSEHNQRSGARTN